MCVAVCLHVPECVSAGIETKHRAHKSRARGCLQGRAAEGLRHPPGDTQAYQQGGCNPEPLSTGPGPGAGWVVQSYNLAGVTQRFQLQVGCDLQELTAWAEMASDSHVGAPPLHPLLHLGCSLSHQDRAVHLACAGKGHM